MAYPPDDATLIRALKLKRLPSARLRDVEARFGVKPRALRAAATRLGEAARWTDADLVLSGMVGGGEVSAVDLLGWIDFMDHVVWTDAELRARLATLEAQGAVVRTEDGWRIAGDWP